MKLNYLLEESNRGHKRDASAENQKGAVVSGPVNAPINSFDSSVFDVGRLIMAFQNIATIAGLANQSFITQSCLVLA